MRDSAVYRFQWSNFHSFFLIGESITEYFLIGKRLSSPLPLLFRYILKIGEIEISCAAKDLFRNLSDRTRKGES